MIEFVYNNYYNATKWKLSTSHLLKDYKKGTKLSLKFIPLQPTDPIYIAGTYWPDLNLKENVLDVNSIKVTPVYKLSFKLKLKFK